MFPLNRIEETGVINSVSKSLFLIQTILIEVRRQLL